jgi:hypothetical protein
MNVSYNCVDRHAETKGDKVGVEPLSFLLPATSLSLLE